MHVLVFDIGGTKTRAGVFDVARSVLVRSKTVPTPNHLERPQRSFAELRAELVGLMDELAAALDPGRTARRVSVAFAGPVDQAGNVLAAPTVWGTTLTSPCPLARELEQVWPHARVRVINDVTAAGHRYLSPGRRDFAVITVSSGIGHKVFVNGAVALGANARGGEIGHLRVDDSSDAPVCECGGRGHLGAIASGRGVLQRARQTTGRTELTNAELVPAFHDRQSWAVDAVQRGAVALGLGLAAMHLAIGLERFILIGGFATALGEPYRKLVAEAAMTRCWSGATGDWSSWVELGAEDDHSGLIGAGLASIAEEHAP
ncbi:MAG: ROK family protein [Myxococcaceae bacterium]